VPKTGAAGRQCATPTIRQTCIGSGFWGTNVTCPDACYLGNCETCVPGTFQCVDIGGGSALLEICDSSASLGSSSTGVGWTSYDSCTPLETCNANTGACTGSLLLPRDRAFDVVPRRRGSVPWHEVLNTALDSDYG
jgi:hypothetical protein